MSRVFLAFGVYLPFVGVAIGVLLQLGRIVRALARLEQQHDVLWDWYLSQVGLGIPGGRRKTDPPGPPPAYDQTPPPSFSG